MMKTGPKTDSLCRLYLTTRLPDHTSNEPYVSKSSKSDNNHYPLILTTPSPFLIMLCNNQLISSISDGHLEMLTRLRTRAESRESAREEIFEEACILMQDVQGILRLAHTYDQSPTASILHAMEQRMQLLLHEMADLWYEGVHDSRIMSAIWDQTSEYMH